MMEQQYSVFVYLQDKLIRVNFCPVTRQVEAFEYEYENETGVKCAVCDEDGLELDSVDIIPSGKF